MKSIHKINRNYISVRKFVQNGGLIGKKYKEPVTEGFVYRIIREYENGKRSSLPFEYERIANVIRIKQ